MRMCMYKGIFNHVIFNHVMKEFDSVRVVGRRNKTSAEPELSQEAQSDIQPMLSIS